MIKSLYRNTNFLAKIVAEKFDFQKVQTANGNDNDETTTVPIL